MIGALTLGALAWAAPPQHVRAVAVAPERFADLDGAREVRVWWDDTGAPLEVEGVRRGEWTRVASGASPGVSVGRLPPGAVLRVRTAEGEVSEPVSVTWVVGPSALARLAAPEALPGLEVSDIAPTEDGAWVALLEGGLAYAPKDALRVEPMGLSEGLPSGHVVSVAADGERLWVGTDAGLALLEGGQVRRVWTAADGLPDDWVQTLSPGVNDDVWVGTYGGLANLRTTGAVQELLSPYPVYSLTPYGEGAPWVGYAGLYRGEVPVPAVGGELAVWDLDLSDGRLYLATDTEGVLRLEDGLLLPYWRPRSGAAYALQRQREVLYIAADTAGLVAVSEREGPLRAWGVAEGLPGDAVYEVVAGPPEKLWVGTSGGLAMLWPTQDVVVPWPRSPLAAGLSQSAVYATEDFALIGGEEGVVALGELPRAWRDVEALPGPILHIAALGRALWVVGPEHAWRVERGGVARVDLPIEASHAALAGETLFIAGPEGAMRLDAEQQRFVPLPVSGPVKDMRAGPGGLCWLAAGRAVLAVDASGQHRVYALDEAPRALAPGEGVLWLGTVSGLTRMDMANGELDAPLAVQDLVQDLALDSQGHPVVLGEHGAIFDGLTGVLLADPGLSVEVGEWRSMSVDTQDRVWLYGERGAMLLSR